MNFNFIPFTAVGNFFLNSNIYEYKFSYDFEYVENFAPETRGDPDRYDLEVFGLSLWVVDSLIENIKCYKYFIYKSKNLIGMSIEKFIEHTGERYYGR